MKITDIKTFFVGVQGKNLLVVKVETDQGIHGIGQGGTTTREKAMTGAIEQMRHFLVGQDPRRIEDINQEMYRGQYYEGGTIIAAVTSAIDIALWDILGKHLNTPVWQLLGGATRQQVTCYIDGPGRGRRQLRRSSRGPGQEGLENHPLRPRDRRSRLPPGPGQHLRTLGVHRLDGRPDPAGPQASGTQDPTGHRLPPPSQRGRSGRLLPAHPGTWISCFWKSPSGPRARMPTRLSGP